LVLNRDRIAGLARCRVAEGTRAKKAEQAQRDDDDEDYDRRPRNQKLTSLEARFLVYLERAASLTGHGF
jgi:hypothetical protein